MVLVKQIFQRELNNNPTSKFKSFNISTKEYVEAMQHSLTLIVSFIFAYIKIFYNTLICAY